MNVYCNYIDSCYPDYIQDHHNGDNEQLICASFLQEDMESLIEELINNVKCSANKIPNEITDEQIERTIRNSFENYYNFESICKKSIDLDDEENADLLEIYEGYQECFVYAYLTWQPEDGLKRVSNTLPMRTINMSDSERTMFKLERTMSTYCVDYYVGAVFVVDTDATEYFWLVDELGNKLYVPLKEKECFTYC